MTSLRKVSELARIKGLMSQLGVSPNKQLGQNFLINESVINKIITYQNLADRAVVEIGPGLGALTTRISDCTHELLLIEFDKKLSEYWTNEGMLVENSDALKFEWSKLDEKYKILISNLPYDISASLVISLSVVHHSITTMVLMFQKEVAQRICAQPDNKNYGLISVIAQNIWDVKKIADLRANDFYPPPKIESRVLAFEKKNSENLSKQFLSFVKHCFLNRRKMVIKNLLSYGKSLGKSDNEVRQAMETVRINLKSRPENISPEQYMDLFNTLN